MRERSIAVAAGALLVASIAAPSVARAQSAPAAAPVATPPAANASPVSCPMGHGCCHGCCHHHCGGRLRWVATGASVASLTTAVVFTVLAVNLNAQLTQAYAARDPNHTMPPSAYADLHALDAQRERFQDLAIGFYVGTGVMAAAATVLWLLPHGPQRPVAQPTVAFDVAPGAANLTVRF